MTAWNLFLTACGYLYLVSWAIVIAVALGEMVTDRRRMKEAQRFVEMYSAIAYAPAQEQIDELEALYRMGGE